MAGGGKPQSPGFDGDDVHEKREYVVGSNTGMRRWFIRSWGQPLRSITWPYYWHGRGPHGATYADYGSQDNWRSGVPSIGNQLGFYAYYEPDRYVGFDDGNLYRVGGLIEGYGRCVVGTKGFRAEKAVILAFNLDDLTEMGAGFLQSPAGDIGKEEVRGYLERWYPTVPIFNTFQEMTALIPLSSKPEFTRYDDEDL